jgi:hypothetical protein
MCPFSPPQAAYNYDGATIGRLVFEVKTAPNGTAERVTCGTAGGKAFDLLPENYAVTSLGVACAPATGTGRKLHQSSGLSSSTGPKISSEGLTVEAGPVWSLEAEVARLKAAGITGVGYAVGVLLYNSALPKPLAAASIFKSENTSLAVSAIAASSDGSKLVALLAQDPYTLATSKDGGATFGTYHSIETDAIADNDAWVDSLGSSADGQVLFAANNPWLNSTEGVDSILDIYQNGNLWVSRDGGMTWTSANLPEKYFNTEFLTVSTSADGTTLLAFAQVRNGSYINTSDDNGTTTWEFEETSPAMFVSYISTDGGEFWSRNSLDQFQDMFPDGVPQLSVEVPRPLQVSADGTRLFILLDRISYNGTVAGQSGSAPNRLESMLLASDDQGLTWNSILTTAKIYDFATGGNNVENGETIVVLSDQGIHVLNDGLSFALVKTRGIEEDGEEWNSVDISRNGKYIAVAADQGFYFAVSNDAGQTWEQFPVNPSYWTIGAVSDEGGITSFDEDSFLWTQGGPSNGGSKLVSVPSSARAASRISAAATLSSAKSLPPTDAILLFYVLCSGSIDTCDAYLQIVRNLQQMFGPVLDCSTQPFSRAVLAGSSGALPIYIRRDPKVRGPLSCSLLLRISASFYATSNISSLPITPHRLRAYLQNIP